MRTDVISASDAPAAAPPERAPRQPAEWAALATIALLTAILNLVSLSQNGYGNTYYAAAVRSMLESWHNFFFVSFDPGGFVTVDKPPLGLWLQAASAKLFGFSGFSLILPEALAGIASVIVLYLLVRRSFGPVAGLLAALALALTPVSVVVSRVNILDATLTLLVLLAAWAVLRAAETGRLLWLLLCGVLLALGFNTKMLQAYLVVPAFALLYLLAAPRRWRVRLAHLALAGGLMLALSLAWVVAVDLTPAASRPYVGSSQTNSELELALGYNGLQRLTGHLFNFGGSPQQATSGASSAATPPSTSSAGSPAGGGGPGGVGENGQPGPLRLLNAQLGGQVGWLLVFALLGLLTIGWEVFTRARRPAEDATGRRTTASLQVFREPQAQALVLWGGWLLTEAVFFSVAGFFHTYYLAVLAPAICALFAGGAVTLWRAYRRGAIDSWLTWLLPLAFILTALVQATLIAPYAESYPWLTPLVVGLALLAALGLLVARLAELRPESATAMGAVARLAALGGVSALLLAPAVWSLATVAYADAGTIPVAGPRQQGTFAQGGRRALVLAGMPPGVNPGAGLGANPAGGANASAGDPSSTVDTALLQYLNANRGDAAFLVATTNSQEAAPIIIQTGEAVMTLGGFSGSDPILTLDALQQRIAAGQVRYFLLGGGGGSGGGSGPGGLGNGAGGSFPASGFSGGAPGGGGGGQNSSLVSWVTATCTAIPSGEWSGGQSASGTGGDQQLFDCASAV